MDDWGKEVSFRPDFTILNKRTGKVLLYEHFGKMDEEKYVNNAMGKIRVYERNGYIIGKNLLLTFETSRMPLSSSTISMLIKEFFT